jgi:hypothetical protein
MGSLVGFEMFHTTPRPLSTSNTKQFGTHNAGKSTQDSGISPNTLVYGWEWNGLDAKGEGHYRHPNPPTGVDLKMGGASQKQHPLFPESVDGTDQTRVSPRLDLVSAINLRRSQLMRFR